MPVKLESIQLSDEEKTILDYLMMSSFDAARALIELKQRRAFADVSYIERAQGILFKKSLPPEKR